MSWQPDPARHERMAYARCGRSGLLLPRIAQGLRQNFGETAPAAEARAMLRRAIVTPDLVRRLAGLDAIARERGQSLAQLALAWVLRDPRVTSAPIGARRVEQVEACLRALDANPPSAEELARIDALTLVDGRDLRSTPQRR